MMESFPYIERGVMKADRLQVSGIALGVRECLLFGFACKGLVNELASYIVALTAR